MFFRPMEPLWASYEITIKYGNQRLYSCIVASTSILQYDCETWPIRVKIIKKLTDFDHSYLKYILEIPRIKSASTCINSTTIERFGHVLRYPPQELRFYYWLNSVMDGVKNEDSKSRPGLIQRKRLKHIDVLGMYGFK